MDMLYVSGTSPVIKVALKNSKHQTNKCTIFYFCFLLQKGNIYLLKSFIVTNLFTKSFVLYSAYQTSSFNFLAKDEKRKSWKRKTEIENKKEIFYLNCCYFSSKYS